ncbi:MAG: S8 family serine peptidase [Rhodothermaceae bacterium]
MKLLKLLFVSFFICCSLTAQPKFLVQINKNKNINLEMKNKIVISSNSGFKELAKSKQIKKIRKLKLKNVLQDVDVYLIEFSTEVSEKELYDTGIFSYVAKQKLDNDINMTGGTITTIPTDPEFSNLLSLLRMNFHKAWELEAGRDEIIVAVLDTGLDWFHPDLRDNIYINQEEMNSSTTIDWINGTITGDGIDNDGNGYVDDIVGWDFRAGDNNPIHEMIEPGSNARDHGSQVTGPFCVANDRFAIGMAPKVKVIGLKVSEDWAANTIEAIDYCIENNISVINMSYGTSWWASRTDIRSACGKAVNAGIVLVACAQNYNSSSAVYPAGWPEVISVGACDIDDTKRFDSNYGSTLEVFANTEGLAVCGYYPPSDSHFEGVGGGATSSATSIISALAALIKSVNISFTNQEVRNIIAQTCVNIDNTNPSYVGQLGNGRIDAAVAITLATGAPTTPNNFRFVANSDHPQISWEVSTDPNIIGYEIYRKYGNENWILRSIVWPSITTYNR